MTILVTGSTGTIGSQVVKHLVARGANVRALVRSPDKAKFPAEVEVVQGDLLDIDSLRTAFSGVDTLFLLNAVSPDEVTQALISLNLAREHGIERVVYLSVLHSDLYTNVPHFTGKHTVERMIEHFKIPTTILRPAYFMQNDINVKQALVEYGIYPMPIGNVGLSMIDTGDIAEIAALELLRRESSGVPLPIEIIDLVGPQVLTGAAIADIWSNALGKPIHYAGDDTLAFEQQFKKFSPAWMAYDMRLMMERFQSDGMVASVKAINRLETILGRPLRSYQKFSTDTAKNWNAG